MADKIPKFNTVEWYRQKYTGRTSKWHWFPTRHEGDGSTVPVCGANIIAEQNYNDNGLVFLEDICIRCMKKLLKEAPHADKND